MFNARGGLLLSSDDLACAVDHSNLIGVFTKLYKKYRLTRKR